MVMTVSEIFVLMAVQLKAISFTEWLCSLEMLVCIVISVSVHEI